MERGNVDQFWGLWPISVAAVAATVSPLLVVAVAAALPQGVNNLGIFMFASGVIHAAAIAPISRSGWKQPKRVRVCCILSAAFGVWWFAAVIVLPFAPIALGVLWAITISITLASASALIFLGIAAFVAMGLFLAQIPAPLGIEEDFAILIPVAAWHAMATVSIYVSAWIDSKLRARAKKSGVCMSCGYCLEGLTTNTCPECGEPISPPSSPPSARRSAP